MKMHDTLRRAINYLTIDHPFFATLLFEMRLVKVDEGKAPKRILAPEDNDGIAFTMGTDGVHVFYSEKFVNSISPSVCAFALAHEVCHPMLMHLQRVYEHALVATNWTPRTDSHGRGIMRHPLLWNIAGDYVINVMLKDAGFDIWTRALLDEKYRGWTTEKVYEDLAKQAKEMGMGKLKGGMLGDLVEPGEGTDMTEMAEEWKERIVRAAKVAESRGTIPASIKELIKEYTEPVYPAYLLLERYVEEACKDEDYSWRKPNQYMMSHGVILPGPYSERVPHVSVWYDTSGSVDDTSLSKFHKAVGDIMRNARPSLLTLGQCDAGVHSFVEIKRLDEWEQEIHCTGRGGTSFKPPFEYMQEHGLRPTLLIYFTDLEGDFPDPPSYPVIWICNQQGKTAPFGTTVYLDER